MRRASPVEIREAEGGPHLYGVLIQEGRAARRRREVFAPGSVEWPADGVGVLTRHHGAPEVRAVPVREADGRITLKARATDAIRAAVESGRRFMSVEFHALRERRTEGGIREVLRALVPDVALVASPEYAQTGAEVRRRGGYRTRVRTRRRMDCRCGHTKVKVGGKTKTATVVRRVEFTERAFTRIAREIEQEAREVLAITRGAGDVAASTGSGSLTLALAAGGALEILLDPLRTDAGRSVRELIEAQVDVYARPVVDFDESQYEIDGDTAIVSDADFAYVLVKPTDRTEGLDPLKPGRARRGLSMRRRALIAGAA